MLKSMRAQIEQLKSDKMLTKRTKDKAERVREMTERASQREIQNLRHKEKAAERMNRNANNHV
jgi:hypothetical protein